MFKDFAAGASANFFGQFISESIFNHLQAEESPQFEKSVYIASIIAGGFYGAIQDRIKSVLAKTALAVGLNRSLIDVIDRMMGGEGLNYETYIEDYIFDTIIVYYIVLIITHIYKLAKINNKNEEIGSRIIAALPLSISINIYFNIRYPSEEASS